MGIVTQVNTRLQTCFCCSFNGRTSLAAAECPVADEFPSFLTNFRNHLFSSSVGSDSIATLRSELQAARRRSSRKAGKWEVRKAGGRERHGGGGGGKGGKEGVEWGERRGKQAAK